MQCDVYFKMHSPFLQYVLQFDGHGHYEFKSINSSSEEFGS